MAGGQGNVRSAGNSAALRAAQIRKIKVAVRQLGLDDETYRALLLRVTGKSSCSQMSIAERGKVLDALQGQGFVPTRQDKSVYHHRPRDTREPAESKGAMLGKVEALLADAKRPWDYAHGLAKKMFGVDRLEFLRDGQLHKLIAALQIDANRRMKRECI